MERSRATPKVPSSIMPDEDCTAWAMRLFKCSPLKQRKLREISKLLPALAQKQCLDIGSDNGVISLLLRQQGGFWWSADLIPETVLAIGALVHERVFQFDGRTLNFADGELDLVVVVDFLEHIEDDEACIAELARVLRPGGCLIVNVPNPHRGALRSLRNILGQTDAAHGHVRAGYTQAKLGCVLATHFEIEEQHVYGRFFSEVCDIVITTALDRLKGKRGQKGTVVQRSDLARLRKSFRLYQLIYPIFKLMVFLDDVFTSMPANMLIVRARRRMQE